jgi:hypothetical protein
VTTVAAGPSTRAIIYATLEADATLLALLADGAASILPRAKIDPALVHKPFVLVRFEGTGGGGDDMDVLTFGIEVHDRPQFGLWNIDRIIDRIKWLFNHKDWPIPASSSERPRKSAYAGASGEVTDEGWATIKRIARVRVITS